MDYNIILWIDEGQWIAHAPAISGSYGIGATAEQARNDLMDALEEVLDFVEIPDCSSMVEQPTDNRPK